MYVYSYVETASIQINNSKNKYVIKTLSKSQAAFLIINFHFFHQNKLPMNKY